MVNRQKNLLEAFTASANAEKAASEDPTVPGSPSGGPFAPSTARDDALERPRGSLADTLLHPDNRGGLFALVGVLLTLAFLAGRMTTEDRGGEVAAGTGSEAPPPRAELPRTETAQAPPAAAAAASDAGAPVTPAEKALADTRNRYTIKVVEYPDKDRHEDLAWNTLNYLEDQGLQAASLYKGKRLFIVVGAAASQVELDDLLARVKTIDGPPPYHRKAEFDDAYVEKIDNLYERER